MDPSILQGVELRLTVTTTPSITELNDINDEKVVGVLAPATMSDSSVPAIMLAHMC